MWNNEKDGWEGSDGFLGAMDGLAWYVAPTRTAPSRLAFRPQDLAVTLSNAKTGHGRATPRIADIRSLNRHLGNSDAPPENIRVGQTKDAEDLLEEVRQKLQPTAPSRLCCYFVSFSFSAAQLRLSELRGEREIFECRVLRDGEVFAADIRLFQRVCDTLRQEDAERYWAGADWQRVASSDVEYLVGGSLYFPDWKQFPEIELAKTIQYQSMREFCIANNLSMEGWHGPDGPIGGSH